MELITINYCFKFQGGGEKAYVLNVNAASMELIASFVEDPPEWTALTVFQCPNCPLSPDADARCPAAENMVDLVSNFQQLISYDKTVVTVHADERVICSHTTIQRGVCSLMGLLMATSRCPLMSFFKPMARFHLPFSSTSETIWRAAASYLMVQYFLHQEGLSPDLSFKGLVRIYDDIQKVNTAFADRLRVACQNDSMVNAIILLDMYAQAMPSAVSESLDHFKHFFGPYLSHERYLKKDKTAISDKTTADGDFSQSPKPGGEVE